MLRTLKIILILIVSLWGFLGAFQNVDDWDGTTAAVRAATSMSTIDGGSDSWKATSSTFVVWAGSLLIMLSKVAAGMLCMTGAAKMWGARSSSADTFTAAKAFALTGCAVAVAMLFGGFVVVADGWFELWRSDAMRGPVLDSAFRYGGLIALIAIFVALKDD